MYSFVFLVILFGLHHICECSDECYGSFCGRPIEDRNCGDSYTPGDPQQLCGTLYFYDSDGTKIADHQGTETKIRHNGKSGVRNVSKVQQVGIGCFRIYKGRSFTGDMYTLEGGGIKDLQEEGHTMTSIKSVQYDITCEFPETASVPWVAIILSLVGVLTLAGIIFGAVKCRHKYTQAKTEEVDLSA